VVCSNCNYTDTYQEFGKPRKDESRFDRRGNHFKNLEKFNGFAKNYSRTLDESIKSYYLNIVCLSRTTGDPLRYAKAWMRLYWSYKDQKSDEFAKEAAEAARHFYSRYLEKNADNISTNDHMRLNATLGELCVALGEYEKGMEYYKENTVMGRRQKDDFVKQCLKRYNEIKCM
jgi:uncharacterized protein (DUF2225 family)